MNPPIQKTAAENKALALKQSKTKQRLSQIDEYFTARDEKDSRYPLLKVTDIADYKTRYTPLDVKLSDLVQNLSNDFLAKKLYHFGYEKPAFKFGTGSRLVKEPCNCSGDKRLSIADKRQIRGEAESYIANWYKAAKAWIEKGGNEIAESQILQKSEAGRKTTYVDRQPKIIKIKKG